MYKNAFDCSKCKLSSIKNGKEEISLGKNVRKGASVNYVTQNCDFRFASFLSGNLESFTDEKPHIGRDIIYGRSRTRKK